MPHWPSPTSQEQLQMAFLEMSTCPLVSTILPTRDSEGLIPWLAWLAKMYSRNLPRTSDARSRCCTFHTYLCRRSGGPRITRHRKCNESRFAKRIQVAVCQTNQRGRV